jgi:hypothetical protein
MKPLLMILLCFVQVVLNAQDTIYKRSGDIIPARVIEINTKEISYRRENLPDGPLYILDKNEVKKIKYKTGAVDSFTVYNDVKAMPEELKNVGRIYTYNEQLLKARLKGTYLYHGTTISDTKAMLLAEAKNRDWKNPELQSEIMKARKNKSLQYTSGFGGLGLGLLMASSGIVYSINNPLDGQTPMMLLFANGIGAIVAGQIISVNFKIRRVKHSNKAVDLYNQNL